MAIEIGKGLLGFETKITLTSDEVHDLSHDPKVGNGLDFQRLKLQKNGTYTISGFEDDPDINLILYSNEEGDLPL